MKEMPTGSLHCTRWALVSFVQFFPAQRRIWLSLTGYRSAVHIHVCKEQRFLIPGQCNTLPVIIGDDRLTGKMHLVLLPNTVAHCDVDAVLKSLDPDFPLKQLRRLCFRIRSWNEDQIRTPQGLCPNAFRVVTVKTDNNTDPAERGVKHRKSFFRGRIIILLVELLTLRDMNHLLHPDRFSLIADQKTHIIGFAVLRMDIEVRRSKDFMLFAG